MTLGELRKATKCHIFVEYTDMDGATVRKLYQGGGTNMTISTLKIAEVKLYGFVLVVELEKE